MIGSHQSFSWVKWLEQLQYILTTVISILIGLYLELVSKLLCIQNQTALNPLLMVNLALNYFPSFDWSSVLKMKEFEQLLLQIRIE